MQNFILFQSVTDLIAEFVFKRQKTVKNNENFRGAEELSSRESLNFYCEKFVVREEEETVEMENSILFQTVTDLSEEFVFKIEEKLKNKENFMCEEELSSWEN